MKQTLPSPEQFGDDLLADHCLSQLDFCKAELWAPSAEPKGWWGFPALPKLVFSRRLSPKCYFSAPRPLGCSSSGSQAGQLQNWDFYQLRIRTVPRLESVWFSTGIARTPYWGEDALGGILISTGSRVVFQKPQPALQLLAAAKCKWVKRDSLWKRATHQNNIYIFSAFIQGFK